MENLIKYEGEIDLGDFKLPCYVIADGTRVLSGNAMQVALNMVDEDEVNKSGSRLARYIGQKTLEPYIYKDKEAGHYDPIVCYKGDTKINGYEATILVDICEAFLKAREEINLSARQKIIAKQCEILVRSFAKIGIIALVDEATGYQYDREKKELQVILKTFISDEILKWQETFQLSFYKEIFRLWNIPFTAKNISRKPLFIGKLTNEFVYKNLPKGVFVLEKLKEKTPKTKGGNLKYRLHQSLTENVGREALKKVIYSVETLASISDTKKQFLRHLSNKYGQRELPFTDLDELDEVKKDIPKNAFDGNLKRLLNVPPHNKDK